MGLEPKQLTNYIGWATGGKAKLISSGLHFSFDCFYVAYFMGEESVFSGRNSTLNLSRIMAV